MVIVVVTKSNFQVFVFCFAQVSLVNETTIFEMENLIIVLEEIRQGKINISGFKKDLEFYAERIGRKESLEKAAVLDSYFDAFDIILELRGPLKEVLLATNSNINDNISSTSNNFRTVVDRPFWFTKTGLAHYLNRSRPYVYGLIEKGLKVVQNEKGNDVILHSDLDQYLENQKRMPKINKSRKK